MTKKASGTRSSKESTSAISPTAALIIAYFAFLSFFLLDLQGVSTGDDLGYAFTDTKLHAADGEKVTGLADIFITQANHYQTTNGRFIIHSLTQLFASLAPRWVFSLFNAAVFVLLWWLSCKLILPPKSASGRRKYYGMGEGLFMLILLWLSVPRPGVTMLSLEAFAINYLWTAVATVAFMIWWRKAEEGDNRHRHIGIFRLAGMAFVAMIIGSLQESFSIPVCAGMSIIGLTIKFRFGARRIALASGYLIGALIEIAAPGNWARVAGSGGLFHSASGMLLELAFSSVTLLALLIIVGIFISPRAIAKWCGNHLMLLMVVCVAVLLGGATFTAIRQLFAPCLFAGLLIGSLVLSGKERHLLDSRIATLSFWVTLIAMLGGGWMVREKVSEQYSQLIGQTRSGNGIIWADASENLYNKELSLKESGSVLKLLSRFNDDPMEGRDLKYLYDGYTKRGFSRLYSPSGKKGSVSTILPASPDSIMAAAHKALRKGDMLIPGKLDNKYAAFAMALVEGRTYGSPIDSHGHHVSFERFKSGDSTYFVVGRDAGPIKLLDRSNAVAAVVALE